MALETHKKQTFQPDPELGRKLKSENCECALIEVLNNQLKILEK